MRTELVTSICFLVLVASTRGLPLNQALSTEEVKPQTVVNKNNGDRYLLLYSLSDQQFRYERGYFKRKPDSDEAVWTVFGRYRFTAPDGQVFSYKYTTADGGFQQQAVPDDGEDALDIVNRIDPKALASLVG